MRERLTYANVMSTIAVFVAVGLGGAYAADKITSKDLAKGSVKSKAIKNRTIVGKDVKDGTLSQVDLAPVQFVAPALGNGGQNDCLWVDGSAEEPGLGPAGYSRNAFGEITMTGIVQSSDGPGGDGTCNGGPPDSTEDGTMFVLRQGDIPAKSHVYLQPGGAIGMFVIGADGLLSGTTMFQPGAVIGATNETYSLDGVSFLAADAGGAAPTSGGEPDRISPRRLRSLLNP